MSTCTDGLQRSRAYQLEMFEHSMRTNIVVCMATGSGKTNVAKLRIEAELRRTPHKKVWFTAPNVVLAEQQHYFLSAQLPRYTMRTLLGYDNVDFWRTQQVWNAALEGINVVVSTPQVLLDALNNAFVKFDDLSLLIVDEAHHCQGDTPSARVMRDHYHRHRIAEDSYDLPHVLGLTASIRISHKTASIAKLESTLNAVCRTPTLSIEDYSLYVHRAQILALEYEHFVMPKSNILELLASVVSGTLFTEDPYYKALKGAKDLASIQKVAKIEAKMTTPALKELCQLLNNAENLHETLGSWASTCFINSCVVNWHNDVLQQSLINPTTINVAASFVDSQLSRVRADSQAQGLPTEGQLAPKALRLIQFLAAEYHPDIAIIIFVERRSAAYALCQLLQASPVLNGYRIFSFVGLATSRAGSLIEVADMKMQKKAFADFRAGSQDICIATSVAEEGVDIQAVNIVIRYDDPKQFVSFLQSRGRARQQDSKFVYFRNVLDATSKYAQWEVFERELETEYQNNVRDLQALQNIEEQPQATGEEYVVSTTGAILNYDNSMQHLEHFCRVSSKDVGPVYILKGESGSAMTARVVLPSCVPAELQEFNSNRSWPGEKSAKKDAAFQAYKAIHEAGQITDHLVPFRPEKFHEQDVKHGSQLYDLQGEHPVWRIPGDAQYFQYLIKVTHRDEQYSETIITLPCLLDYPLRFPLYESAIRTLNVEVIPYGTCELQTIAEAKPLTKSMFAMIFDKGSAFQSLDECDRIPVCITPGMELSDTDERYSLSVYLEKHPDVIDQQPLLLWIGKSPRPYIWHPPHSIAVTKPSHQAILVTKVRKLQLYTRYRNAGEGQETPHQTVVGIDSCETRGVHTTHGPVGLLLPSILHMVAAGLRAQVAEQSLLQGLGLSTRDHLTAALIAKSASAGLNYERLEFLGDTYLKYRASLHMYFDMPDAMEGVLTRKVMELVSNSSLEKAVTELGLAPFITTESTIQKHWKLPRVSDGLQPVSTRKVHSKTLADVVESVLAAAFLDSPDTEESDQRCTSTLQLFLPRVHWLNPKDIVSTLLVQQPKIRNGQDLVLPIQNMFGYKFQRPALLQEALTHSAAVQGVRSLERLEFLGDAILDRIIKEKLFSMSKLGPDQMTIHRHALASHAYLAYCAFTVSDRRSINAITAVDRQHRPQITPQTSTIYLEHLIQFGTSHLQSPISAAREKYNQQRAAIAEQLEKGVFPWTLLRSLDAPKLCSDIIEALVAAVYIDSSGSLPACEKILDVLGVTALLQKMIETEGFESRTPSTMLRELCAPQAIAVDFKAVKTASSTGHIWKVVLRNQKNNLVIEYDSPELGCAEEARSMAAEVAMQAVVEDRHQQALFAEEEIEATQDSVTTGMGGEDAEEEGEDADGDGDQSESDEDNQSYEEDGAMRVM